MPRRGIYACGSVATRSLKSTSAKGNVQHANGVVAFGISECIRVGSDDLIRGDAVVTEQPHSRGTPFAVVLGTADGRADDSHRQLNPEEYQGENDCAHHDHPTDVPRHKFINLPVLWA